MQRHKLLPSMSSYSILNGAIQEMTFFVGQSNFGMQLLLEAASQICIKTPRLWTHLF